MPHENAILRAAVAAAAAVDVACGGGVAEAIWRAFRTYFAMRHSRGSRETAMNNAVTRTDLLGGYSRTSPPF